MAKKTLIEKRQHVRARHVVSIYHRIHSHNGKRVKGVWQTSLTENLSSGGVLFASNVLYQLSDILS